MMRAIVAAFLAFGCTAEAVRADPVTLPDSHVASSMNGPFSYRAAMPPEPAPRPAMLVLDPAPPRPFLTGRATAPAPARPTVKAWLPAPPRRYDETWIRAQPAASGGDAWQCLTQALYFEARGEKAEGLFAVAEVILNRVDSAEYPDSVCGVVNQGTGHRFACQFTYTCDGRPETVRNPEAWTRVGKVARAMLDGAPRRLTGGAVYYHARAVSPGWSQTHARTASIGVHLFYR